MRSLVGRASHTLFGESTPGDKPWLRLHNPKHSPTTPRCQALSALQANAERNFGLQANPAPAGANKLYAGAKKEAV